MSPRFNPLTNESDMFKVLIGAVALCALVVLLVMVGRAIF